MNEAKTPERMMEAYPISRKAKNPKHDSPDLIEPTQEIYHE